MPVVRKAFCTQRRRDIAEAQRKAERQNPVL